MISTDVQGIQGTVSYTHHVHSLAATDENIINDSAELTTDGYEDAYQSPESGGCFTRAYYHIPKYVTGSHKEYHNHVWWNDYGTARWRCDLQGCSGYGQGETTSDYSGAEMEGRLAGQGTYTVNEYSTETWTYNPTATQKSHCDKIVYTVSCGMMRGSVTDVHIHYDN